MPEPPRPAGVRKARFILGLRLAARFVVALAMLLAVQALARLPLGAPATQAAIRLALRTAAGKLEVCRDVPPEELAKLPIHMRLPRLCEERPVAYRVALALDGKEIHALRAERRGMRSDRPLVIDDLVEIPSGRHELAVNLEPEVPAGTSASDAARLPRGELRTVVELAPGRIALVTWDPARGLAIRQ